MWLKLGLTGKGKEVTRIQDALVRASNPASTSTLLIRFSSFAADYTIRLNILRTEDISGTDANVIATCSLILYIDLQLPLLDTLLSCKQIRFKAKKIESITRQEL